jgi:hypothetical protein
MILKWITSKTQEKCRIHEIILCSKSFNLLDKLKYGFQFITTTLLVILSVRLHASFLVELKVTSALTRAFARAIAKLIVTCVVMGRRGPWWWGSARTWQWHPRHEHKWRCQRASVLFLIFTCKWHTIKQSIQVASMYHDLVLLYWIHGTFWITPIMYH